MNKDVSKISIPPIDAQRRGVKDTTSGGFFSQGTEIFQKDFVHFLVRGMENEDQGNFFPSINTMCAVIVTKGSFPADLFGSLLTSGDYVSGIASKNDVISADLTS